MVDPTPWDGGSFVEKNDSLHSTTNDSRDDGNSSSLPNIPDDIVSYFAVQIMFSVIYTTIFILGVIGNVLVCYVVMRNKAMQTVTNFFITNLALADILLCVLAVPFTPMYTFFQQWVFGSILCHLVPFAQGTSVYISTLTLTSIAIDRFCVIIYPFRPRMKLTTCLFIILFIWLFALLATLPYGIVMQYKRTDDKYFCNENWPSEKFRQVFSGTTATLQFVFPFTIMAVCYIRVSVKLSDRAKAKPGSKNSRREAVERERKRRTNRMLIAMVAIFGFSWLPLNMINFLNDIYIYAEDWRFYNLLFFFAHSIAMSSTCYNPFLYAWLNENFRKEFKQVLPCFYSSQPNTTRSRRALSERTCNGNETVQESFLPVASSAQIIAGGGGGSGGVNALGSKPLLGTLETIEEQTSNSQSAVAVNYDQVTAEYCSSTNEVQVHIPIQQNCPNQIGGTAVSSAPAAGASFVAAGNVNGGRPDPLQPPPPKQPQNPAPPSSSSSPILPSKENQQQQQQQQLTQLV